MDISKKHYTVQGWFITELGLKGSELQIFAILYGFCQDEESEFYGSLKFLTEWTGLSKRNILRTLQSLSEKGMIYKISEQFNKNCYKVLHDKMSPGSVTKCHPYIKDENIAENTVENNPPTPASGGACAHTDSFEQFWRAYPKKKSKGQAEKAWKNLNPNSELVATILDKIAKAKTCKDWIKEGGRFIPYPATWLNARGWEDETGNEGGFDIDSVIPYTSTT